MAKAVIFSCLGRRPTPDPMALCALGRRRLPCSGRKTEHHPRSDEDRSETKQVGLEETAWFCIVDEVITLRRYELAICLGVSSYPLPLFCPSATVARFLIPRPDSPLVVRSVDKIGSPQQVGIPATAVPTPIKVGSTCSFWT